MEAGAGAAFLGRLDEAFFLESAQALLGRVVAATGVAAAVAGTPLVLPTVWDAWSARVVAGAGFAALSGI